MKHAFFKFKILFVILILILGVLCLAPSPKVDGEINNRTKYFTRCDNSFSQLNEIFSKTCYTRNSTSSQYAGAFIDSEGYLNLNYTDIIPLIDSNIDQTIKKSIVAFSYEELEYANDLVNEFLHFGVNSYGIIQQKNQVEIRVSSIEHKNALVQNLQTKKINTNMYDIIVDSSTAKATAHEIYAGDEIYYAGLLWIPEEYGTMGAFARDNATNALGILTNDHVAKTGKTMRHNTVVLGKKSKGKRSGRIDAAFVPLDKPSNWVYSTAARSGDNISDVIHYGGNNWIVEGYPTVKFGRTSGKNYGNIISTNFSTVVDYNGTLVTYTDCIKVSNSSVSGDSGGPIYAYMGSKSSYYLIALNFAGPKSDSETFGIGCKTDYIQEELNIHICTLDD